MMLWGVVFLVALAGVSAAPELEFPEIVNERLERSAGSLASRIVSGWEAEEGQLPYQLSVRMVSAIGAVSSCGGSIIHEDWGLTAAHCTATRLSFVIRAGAVNLTTPAILFELTEFYNHPEYDDSRPSVVQPNDIALMRFPRKIEFSWRVQPIRVQSSRDMNKDYTGALMVASGWGRTWTNGASPENLNWVFLRGTSNLLCRLTYGNSPIIVDSTICASYYNVTSQSTCQGDSGGLLTVVDDDGQVTQVGVTSFVSGTGCHTDIPAGFIRAGHYHEWFTAVTGIDFDWVTKETTTTEATTTEEGSTITSTTTDRTTTEAATTSESATTDAATTEAATTEAATTEAATSSEAATTEAATTEAATTEAATTSESATTEAATTEAATTEAATTSESATTEAATTEADTTEAATTEAATSSEAATTEAATTEVATTEAATTEAATSSEAVTTEAATTEAATTEAATTEAATTETTDEIVGDNFLNRYFYRFW